MTNNNTVDDSLSLKNENNYNLHINSSYDEIITLFSLLVIDYIKTCIDKNLKSEYIFDTGLKTLINVFKITLINTRNLKLSYYYSQQSYYIFLDFIQQINNVNVSFLNLQTKDAVIFCLKKTIFNVSTNDRMLSNDDKILILRCNNYINIIFNFVNKFSNNYDYFGKIIEYINNIKDLLCNKKKDLQIYENILCFQDFFKDKELNIIEYYQFLKEIIGLLLKKKYSSVTKTNLINMLNIYDYKYNFDTNRQQFVEYIAENLL